MTTTAPDDCDRAFANCVRARDLDGLVALYEPDAHYIRRDGTVVVGQAAIRAQLESLTSADAEIEMNLVKVFAHEGNALIYNDWALKIVNSDGSVRESSGRAVELVRRQPDGRWLFTIDDPFGRSRP
jgi:uncharacterized protein (TIGR02246 family)